MERDQKKGLDKLKKQVWDKIKGVTVFEFPFKQQIIELIEDNLERIEFVKDHLGVRDFLFLAESGTNYTSELFAAFDVNAEIHESNKQKKEAFIDQYDDDPYSIIAKIKAFFNETNRTLYVGVGFMESETTEEQIHRAQQLYSTGVANSPEEAMKMTRVFPEWYSDYARMPEEIDMLSIKKEAYSKEQREKELKALIKEIDKTLDDDDEKRFKLLTAKYKKMLQATKTC